MTITVLAHKFTIGDVDDPDIYAAQPMYEWQQSEAGQWMMKYSDPTPSWHQARIPGYDYGTSYQIIGYLTPKLYTFWKLKYE
jgi:hypothetical protein